MSLSCVAELYQEMGKLFSTESYYLKAIGTYKSLASGYPDSQFARDALLAIGEIYSTGLAKPDEAREASSSISKNSPSPPGWRRRKRRSNNSIGYPARRLRRKWRRREIVPSRHANRPFEVTTLRRWVGPNYSRVVIGVDGEVKFETTRLSKPDRIVLDIENARLSSTLTGKTFPAEDGFLRQIRLGQYPIR